ncbi:MAG: hypothetical protein V9E92_00330 [Methylotenera sp.]
MRILILVLLLQLSACTAIFNKGSTAYITNQGDNTVSVIDIVQGRSHSNHRCWQSASGRGNLAKP